MQTSYRVVNTYSSLFYIDYAVGLPLITIFVCYGIAVYLGHVDKPWLPMISDCGVFPPEKYIFRVGLITSAGLLLRAAKMVRDYVRAATRQRERAAGVTPGTCFGIKRSVEDWSVVIVSVSSTCLATVAAVSEQEDNPVHSTAAVIFFVTYIAYMWLMTFRMRGLSVSHDWDGTVFAIRLTISSLVTVAFSFFIWVNVRGLPYNPYAAMPEWFGTLLILLFNLTFRHDFAGTNGINTLYLATAMSQSGGEMQNAWGEESDEE
jgi:hypothetical membrane protein